MTKTFAVAKPFPNFSIWVNAIQPEPRFSNKNLLEDGISQLGLSLHLSFQFLQRPSMGIICNEMVENSANRLKMKNYYFRLVSVWKIVTQMLDFRLEKSETKEHSCKWSRADYSNSHRNIINQH